MNTGDIDKWSQIGIELAKRGHPTKCPTCGHLLRGQRYCPECGSEILYPGETEKTVKRNDRLASAYRSGIKMQKAGDEMGRSGCQIMGCVGFIILIIILGMLL